MITAYVTDSTGSGMGTLVSAISDATINVGGSHTFTCSATPPNGLQSSHLSYQWTNPDAGVYTCTVTASHSNCYYIKSN
jgi:hypothetical protein